MGIVIGLGTGRCGIRSLRKFLNENGVPCTHGRYRLVWVPKDESRWESILNRLESDVGFYWLNYVELILGKYPDAKFICFKRQKENVIASYMRTFMDPVFLCLLWSREKVGGNPYFYRTNVTQKDLNNMDERTREFVEAAWDIPLERSFLKVKEHFPDYPLEGKEAYLNKYYDDYYAMSESLQKRYPENFKIFNMIQALNTIDGNQEILNFIGTCPDTQVQ